LVLVTASHPLKYSFPSNISLITLKSGGANGAEKDGLVFPMVTKRLLGAVEKKKCSDKILEAMVGNLLWNAEVIEYAIELFSCYNTLEEHPVANVRTRTRR
jgi:hypothetical protein